MSRRLKNPNEHLETALCSVLDAGLQDRPIRVIRGEARNAMYVRGRGEPDKLVFMWWKNERYYSTESRIIDLEKALDLIKKNWNRRCATNKWYQKPGQTVPNGA